MASNSITPKLKFKQCAICGQNFKVFSSTQKACSVECAIELARIAADKKEKKETRKAKRRLDNNDRSIQVKKTQQLFNKYIRQRDNDLACISCGRFHTGQYHAGHYRTVGANPELRFNEANCHKQCSSCNNHLSGNLINYRINLIIKIGIDEVEAIEGPHKAKRYTIDELKELQAIYKRKIKELEL